MPDPALLLKDVFGYDAFRPGQEEIIASVIEGQNTLAVLPTGAGKSLCFQLPALCLDGLTVVISPLIALMRDQVRGLQASGVAAGALTSGNTEEETQAVYDGIEAGWLKLLYIAPERLASIATQRMLSQAQVSLIAVDEAHCVSQWGHDFRPDYLKIGDLRARLGVPLAAFTATADQETRDEITQKLFAGEPPKLFLHGFDRPNIHMGFAVKQSPRKQVLRFVTARDGQSGIVYAATRAKTESLAKALREAGREACHYHGGMDAEERRAVEMRFQQEDALIVVATVAFGMGIDKPDIRWVLHADLPKSIEAYYQEIGRAGRDGAPAEALTLYGSEDIRLRRAQIDEGLAPPERRIADHGRLNALLGLAEAQVCRRATLLNYFGDSETKCSGCDLCSKPPELFDGTTAARKALSAVYRTGEYFGSGHLIDILLGRATEKVRARGHDQLPTFGVGQEYSAREWQAIFRQMLGLDLVRPDPERHGALRLMPGARGVLRDEETLTFRKDTISQEKRGPVVKRLVSDEDAPLLSALKAKRRALAEAANVPAYIVFNDRTLIAMAEARPSSLDEMANIPGVGAKKLATYGTAFLDVVTQDAPKVHPKRKALAGQTGGALYDQLLEAQARLARGDTGIEKPLSCSASLLARVVQRKPTEKSALVQILGDRRAERFADAFLEILQEA
ncbi:MAG: DNA helicase RecQ [Pseudomonadota bacterium]